MHLILGSQSPRRRELMHGMDLSFDAVVIDADESYPANLQAGDIPIYISRAKARAYVHALKDDDCLITADTIVWCEHQMLGKPHDEADAHRMLRLISGRTHQVYTGVTLAWRDNAGEVQYRSFVAETDVTFRELTDEEIDYYITHYHPQDKAGAYGIQEWIGHVGCSGMSGSYFNVMGLPVQRLWVELKKIGAIK